MGGGGDYQHDDDAPIGKWGMKYGVRAPRVTVLEREERGPDNQPTLVARWYVNGKRMGPYTVRRVPTIRNEKGVIDMETRQAAEQEAKRIWEEVQAGTDPDVIFAPSDEEDAGEDRTPKDALTLGEGLDLFMDPEEGHYAGETESEWYEGQRRRARRLKDVLGRGTLWVDLVPAKIRALWVKLHRHYEETEHTGRRESIRTVQLLGTARKWLVANNRLTPSAPELPDGWRNALKNHWQRHADEEITVSRPVHSENELRLIAAAVRDDSYDIDPRFRALMRMALGQRLGAVGTRALRSNLQLDDYHLLPGGKLVDGKARVGRGDEPVQDRWMGNQLHDLEAEVYRRNRELDLWSEEQRENETMHVYRRGWHGLRRGMVELLDRKEVNPSVRNAMLGWVPGSRVPEFVYQSRDSEQRYRRAAETREEVTEALGVRVPGGDDEEDRTRADVRNDIDDAMEADDMGRVRELMAELDELEDGGDR